MLSAALKHLFHSTAQIIPVAYNHNFNHPFPPEENVPKAIKYTAFFFSPFNLDVHWRYIQQNHQHIKKTTKKAETCLTGAEMCLDNNHSNPIVCRLQLLILLAAAETLESLEMHLRVFGKTPACNRDRSGCWEFYAGVPTSSAILRLLTARKSRHL